MKDLGLRHRFCPGRINLPQSPVLFSRMSQAFPETVVFGYIASSSLICSKDDSVLSGAGPKTLLCQK